MLGGEVSHLGQARDAAEQEFELTIRCTGHVLRDLVAGEGDRHPGQTPLRVRGAQDAAAADQADRGRGDGLVLGLVNDEADGRAVRDKERVARCLGEALRTVEGHVVQRHERAVGKEEVVEAPTAHNDVVGAFDDRREHRPARGWGFVSLGEQRVVAADRVVGRRCVDGLLDIASVEIVVGTLGISLSVLLLTWVIDGVRWSYLHPPEKGNQAHPTGKDSSPSDGRG